jgi:hypothetical protein
MYAQAFQDEFVDIVLNHQKHGFYVDVGGACDDHKNGSNTLMFEERGWDGILVDGEPNNRMSGRKCKFVQAFVGEGTDMQPLGKILKQHNVPQLVDYLSIDIEGQDYYALKSFLDEGFEFKVATIEHNLYSRNPWVDAMKSNIFNILNSRGYVRVVENAGHCACLEDFNRGWAFEDWFVNPKYITAEEVALRIKNKRSELS